MAYTFNAPPNWPQPPEGWRPGPGWQPDPSWGPAPDGWVFWKDEQGRPVGSDGAPLGSDAGSGGPDASSGGPGTGPAYPGAGSPGAGSSAAGSSAAAATGGSGGAGWGGSGGGGWNGSGPGNGSGAGRGPGDPGPGGPGGPGGGYDSPRKKGFFATTGGILTIIGGVLLILVIVLVVVLVGFFRNAGSQVADDDREVGPSAAASSSPPESSEASPSASSGSASSDPDARPTGTRPEQGIEPTTVDPVYSFNGRGDQQVQADLDPSTVYYVEYWYEGESNFIVWGLDDEGEEGGLMANEIGTTAGSHWVDADDLYSTEGFSVDTDDEGVWELKVYDSQALGISDTEGEAQLNGTVAFGYTGAAKEATFANESDDALTLTAYGLDGTTLFSESVPGSGTVKVDLPASSEDNPALVQVESIYGESKWTVTFG